MPIKWNADADVALLMAMIEVSGVKTSSKGFWKSVIEKIGEGTDRSFEQRYTAIRKRRDANGPGLSATCSTPTSVRTQTPRKRKADAVETPTRKRTKLLDYGDDSDEANGTMDKEPIKVEPKLEEDEDAPF